MIDFIRRRFFKALTKPRPIDLWDQVAKKWKTADVNPRPGASIENIRNFQLMYNIVLPSDFLNYLQTVDGTGEWEMDDHLFHFWTLDQIKPVHEVLGEPSECVYPRRFAHADCFVFADLLINSDLYAIKLTRDEGQPAPIFHGAGVQIAPSFREFMRRYVEDPASLIHERL